MSINVFNITLAENDQNLMPVREHGYEDSGFDLKAYKILKVIPQVDYDQDFWNLNKPVYLKPHLTYLVSTGIRIELKSGYEAQIRTRSGLALKQGLVVLNSPGTVDAGYRNEIGVILRNLSNHDIELNKYDRIAQMVINQIPLIDLNVVSEINLDTNRNQDGFGSTGVNKG